MSEFTPMSDTSPPGEQVAVMPHTANRPVLAEGTMSYPVTTNEDFKTYEMEQRSATSSGDGKSDLRLAKMYWRRDTLVFKCVQLLGQLANSHITVTCENEEFQDLVRIWLDMAMPFSFREQWFTDYFRLGMVPVFKSLIPYKPRNYRTNKIPQTDKFGNVTKVLPAAASETKRLLSMQGEKYERLQWTAQKATNAKVSYEAGIGSPEKLQYWQLKLAEAQYEWSRGLIPGSYTVLDPLSVDFQGPDFAWLRLPYFTVDGSLRKAIIDPRPEQVDMVNALPVEVVTQITRGAHKIWLSPNICTICYGDKQAYEPYPTPFVSHAFPWLRMKEKMRAMDEATIESTKNRILLVKVGDKDFPVQDQETLAKVQSLFRTGGSTMQLFWNHAIALEWIEPDLTSLLDSNKYNWVDDQIRTVFGISRILTGTSETSGAIGNSIMNFKGVEEMVTSAQEKYIEFLQGEIRMLKAALGVGYDVSLMFSNLNMTDVNKYIAVLNQMVLNGILDPQSALESLKFHFPTVKSRMEKFKTMRGQGLFVPLQMGVQKELAELAAETQRKTAVKAPKNGGQGDPSKGGGTPTGGKPANSPLADNNDNKRGTSQPKKAAAARLMQSPLGPVLVVDDNSLTDDDRTELERVFEGVAGSDLCRVMTAAEYGEAFECAVNFLQPLPALSLPDTAMALKDAAQITKDADHQYNQQVNKLKQDNKGKRGPYLTEARRNEFWAEAHAHAVVAFAQNELGDTLPESWDQYFADQVHELADSYEDQHELQAAAAAVLVRKLKRLEEVHHGK